MTPEKFVANQEKHSAELAEKGEPKLAALAIALANLVKMPNVLAPANFDTFSPNAQSDDLPMELEFHTEGPGTNWTLTDDTKQSLKDIDDAIRLGRQEARNIIVG